MTAFDKALALVLRHEGGLVDDPRDPGGLTNCGISQRAYPDLDIRNLKVADIALIYRTDYWDAIKGDWVGWGGDTLANVSCEVDCIVTSHGQKFDNQLV
jgi:lysozyme family protein